MWRLGSIINTALGVWEATSQALDLLKRFRKKRLMDKLKSLFGSVIEKFLAAIPLLNSFITVKVAENDLPAIREALANFGALCEKGKAFADKGDAMVADRKLELTEMEELIRDLVSLVDEAGDVVKNIREAG